MNHKEYLLGLLDDSCTPSHEGIGMVIARLEALERVAELTHTLKHVVDHLPQQDEHFESFLRQTSDKLEDALAALEDK